MAELLKNIQSYWDMRAGGFSDASMEERKTEIEDRKKEETRILYVAMTRAIQQFIYFDNNKVNNMSWVWRWLFYNFACFDGISGDCGRL